MHVLGDQGFKNAHGEFKATLKLLGFGVFTLAFLIGIDHPQWFHIRPASGASEAISHAAKHPRLYPEKSKSKAASKVKTAAPAGQQAPQQSATQP